MVTLERLWAGWRSAYIETVTSEPTDDACLFCRLAAEDPRVKPIFRSPPNGVGRAIADGYRAATGQYVLSMDSDFQHLLPELRDLFDAAAGRQAVDDVF